MIGKALPPEPRRQHGHVLRRVARHPLQYIDQILVRIDAVQFAGDHQTLQHAELLRTQFAPAELAVLSTHRYHPQAPHEMARVDLYGPIAEEYAQCSLPIRHLRQRLAQRVRRQ